MMILVGFVQVPFFLLFFDLVLLDWFWLVWLQGRLLNVEGWFEFICSAVCPIVQASVIAVAAYVTAYWSVWYPFTFFWWNTIIYLFGFDFCSQPPLDSWIDQRQKKKFQKEKKSAHNGRTGFWFNRPHFDRTKIQVPQRMTHGKKRERKKREKKKRKVNNQLEKWWIKLQ
jgi:hypothetical protein